MDPSRQGFRVLILYSGSYLSVETWNFFFVGVKCEWNFLFCVHNFIFETSHIRGELSLYTYLFLTNHHSEMLILYTSRIVYLICQEYIFITILFGVHDFIYIEMLILFLMILIILLLINSSGVLLLKLWDRSRWRTIHILLRHFLLITYFYKFCFERNYEMRAFKQIQFSFSCSILLT